MLPIIAISIFVDIRMRLFPIGTAMVSGTVSSFISGLFNVTKSSEAEKQASEDFTKSRRALEITEAKD